MKFRNDCHEANLLWNNSCELLRNNLEIAKRRFTCLENKFKRDETLFEEYNSILRGQINLGIIEV